MELTRPNASTILLVLLLWPTESPRNVHDGSQFTIGSFYFSLFDTLNERKSSVVDGKFWFWPRPRALKMSGGPSSRPCWNVENKG